MRTIRGQILASTNLDLHGEKLTEDQLRKLFEQTPLESILNKDHDMSKSAVGRMYNKQFVKLDSGEFAIAVDIDILDEAAYATGGGFSISYIRNHYSINPNRKAEIEILFNPRIFKLEEFKPLINLSTDELQIDAAELVQKGLETITLLILGFIGVQVASGFFKQLGSDAYKNLKSWLKNFVAKKKEFGQEVVFQVQFTTNLNDAPVLIIIQFSAENFPILDTEGVSVEEAISNLSSLIENKQIQRATFDIIESPPFWRITSFTDSRGFTTRL
jgi:hypothetical protein